MRFICINKLFLAKWGLNHQQNHVVVTDGCFLQEEAKLTNQNFMLWICCKSKRKIGYQIC